MTCCANDVQFIGYVCQYDGARDLKEGEWVMVEGILQEEFSPGYNGRGPVLHAEKLEKTGAPEDELVYFT